MAIGQTTVKGPRPIGGMVSTGSKTNIGSSFKTLTSGAPKADIKRPIVERPNPGDFGSPVGAPTIGAPNRKDFGTPSGFGIKQAAQEASDALKGFNDPRSTKAFQNLMGLASEVTARQVDERRRGAADASQRSGFSVGREGEAREAERDRMRGLAEAGFAGAASIREEQAGVYATAKSVFAQLQTSYNEAKSAGDIAYAQALTQTHFKNAENTLAAAGLNMQQKLAYGGALNEAKMLQAQLDQQYNNSLIDNNRYIEAQQQIAAQLLAQEMALKQRAKEFEFESGFKEKSLAEEQRQFDLNLKRDPNTALRTFADPRYGGPSGRKQNPTPTSTFSGLF